MNGPLGLFVAGTDTGVGKTAIATALLRAAVAQGHRALGMKPVAAGRDAGAKVNADVAALAAAGNVEAPLALRNPYRFDPPIAPHLAAARVGVVLSLRQIAAAYAELASLADVLVVEGAGGVLVPLTERHDMLDVAACLALPVVLVVGIRLGCLNHALLTELALRSRGVPLCGWVANRIDPDAAAGDESVAALMRRMGAPMLADVPWGSPRVDLRAALEHLRAGSPLPGAGTNSGSA
jgi:dethiobiotin synthetase